MNVDLNIYISKIAKEGFDNIGAKSYYMPLAANPDFYTPLPKTNKISFVGATYGQRPYYMWRLLQNNINVFQIKSEGALGMTGFVSAANTWDTQLNQRSVLCLAILQLMFLTPRLAVQLKG